MEDIESEHDIEVVLVIICKNRGRDYFESTVTRDLQLFHEVHILRISFNSVAIKAEMGSPIG